MIRPGSRHRTLATVAAAAAAATVLLWAGPATSAEVAGISLRPAQSDPHDPTTLSVFKPTVAPGRSFRNEVVVTNGSGATVDLLVSPVDGITAAGSGVAYATRQDPVKEAAAWVHPSVSELRMAPHSTSTVPFTVSVPLSAPPGDHMAGIAFEDARAPTSGPAPATGPTRSVIGVLVKVSGSPVAFHLHLDHVQFVPAGETGTASVVVTLGDDGLLLGKPRLAVTIDGASGYHRTIDRQLDTVLPGDTIDVTEPWPDALPAGDYTVTAQAGARPTGAPAGLAASTLTVRDTVHVGEAIPTAAPATTAAPPTTAAAAAPPAPAPVAAAGHPANHRWWLLLLAVPVVLLLGILAARRRARRRRPQRRRHAIGRHPQAPPRVAAPATEVAPAVDVAPATDAVQQPDAGPEPVVVLEPHAARERPSQRPVKELSGHGAGRGGA